MTESIYQSECQQYICRRRVTEPLPEVFDRCGNRWRAVCLSYLMPGILVEFGERVKARFLRRIAPQRPARWVRAIMESDVFRGER